MLGVTARWWVLLVAIALLVGAAMVYGQTERFLIARGPVSERSQQCSFTIGYTPDAPMLVFAPGIPACHQMRAFVNTKVRVSVEPE